MITAEIKGICLEFETNDRVFSPAAVDAGTLAMLSKADFAENDRVLDLGCGYGAVGILAAKLIGEANVVLCDNSGDALALSRKNAAINGVGGVHIVESDGPAGVGESGFTLILSNPPYHADFSVPKRFIEEGYKKLAPGGRMVMVTKRREWYKNRLIAVFGGVKIEDVDGYFVFTAEKRAKMPAERKSAKAPALSKKLRRKYQG